MAMAPSRAPRKMAIVMSVASCAVAAAVAGRGLFGIAPRKLGVDAVDVALLFRLVHHDQFGVAELSGHCTPEVVQQEHDGRDAEYHADEIEDADRGAGGRCAHVPVDERLLP